MGIDISKINPKNMETKILDLLNNKSYKKNAEESCKKIRDENFRTDIYKSIIEN